MTKEIKLKQWKKISYNVINKRVVSSEGYNFGMKQRNNILKFQLYQFYLSIKFSNACTFKTTYLKEKMKCIAKNSI